MRPKEFELEAIAELAMKVFWQRGYAATSIQDLVDATGIGRGSIYNAFGSKHGIYQFSLKQYYKLTASNIALLSEEGTAKDLIRRLLMKIVSEELNDIENIGCMVANASLEMARHDQGIAELVAKNLMRMERAISTLIIRGQANGEIDSNKNSDALAHFIVSTIQGIRVVSKGAGEEKQASRLEDIVEIALSVI
ncbi:TetR family transcriptional regulator [Acinetobacter sp. TGL-Y2]|uniref:TetR/AcrR family transcriptional regulator n=1 Tax=Acinetobacter sp. TGL-Y2 TaxID=1407071 RepID=UPI0007A649A6|nr:TetR/AcrR family transcriptional regulator [Acinetobacter sp. TGL-Y2]AMW79618.1 TetR family transcriptional regulator [Acinetobacter sp. TGL-Y2]